MRIYSPADPVTGPSGTSVNPGTPTGLYRPPGFPVDPEVTAPVAWGVGQVGRGERTLQLIYAITSCATPGATVTIAETSATVTIGVEQETHPYEQCISAVYPVGTATVRLARPLAGRKIVGALDDLPDHAVPVVPPVIVATRHQRQVQVVPRLIGLAPSDALQALKISGLRTHFCNVPPATGLPRVVAQRPAPGRVLVSRELVHIRLAGSGVDAAAC
jgi:hypothetical protein